MSNGLNNYLLDAYETLGREEEQLLAQKRERRRTLVGGLTLATLLPAVLSAGEKKAGAEVLSPDTFNAAHGVDVIYCGKDPAEPEWKGGYLRDITDTTEAHCDEVLQDTSSEDLHMGFPYVWQAPNGKVLVLSTKGDYPNNTASIRISSADLKQQLGEIPSGNLVGGINHISKEGIVFTGAGTYVLDSTYTNGKLVAKNVISYAYVDQGNYILKRVSTTDTGCQLKAYNKATILNNDPVQSPYFTAEASTNFDLGSPYYNSGGLAIDPKTKILYIGMATGCMAIPLADYLDQSGNFTSMDWMSKAYMDQYAEFIDMSASFNNLAITEDGTLIMAGLGDYPMVVHKGGTTTKIPYKDGTSGAIIIPGAPIKMRHLPEGKMLLTMVGADSNVPARLIPTTDPAKYLYPGVPFELVYLQDAPPLDGVYTDCTGASTAEMVDAILAEGDCLNPPNPCEGVSCDDGNACTDDTCVADGELPSCVNTNNDNNTCDDNDPTTTDDTCVDGACQGTQPDPCADKTCDDDNACTVDVCAVIDGEAACGTNNVENGTTCDDNDPLTTDDLCTDGTCMGVPETCDDADKAACDDNNPCTDDVCNMFQDVAVCSNTSVADEPETLCDDGNPDTGDDKCVAGVCEGALIVQPEPDVVESPDTADTTEPDPDVTQPEPDAVEPPDTTEPRPEITQPDTADVTELSPDFLEVQTDFAGEFETAETEIAGVDVEQDRKHPLDVDQEEGTQPNTDADTQGNDTTTNPEPNPEVVDGGGSTCSINGPLNAQNSPDAMPMALTLGATLSALVLAGRQRFKNLFARN